MVVDLGNDPSSIRDMHVDCSLLMRLCDIHVDCGPVIEFGRFVIREFEGGGIWELGNPTRKLLPYEGLRQLDGALPSPGTVFKEESFSRMSMCGLFPVMCFSVYVICI